VKNRPFLESMNSILVRARTLAAFALALATVAIRTGSAADSPESQAVPAVSIAAAANLVYALDALDTAFGKEHPGVKLTSATGASGTLVAQIRNGAPYDVFLSADLDFAKKLIQAGGASASSLHTFAIGRLVLWTTRPGLELGSIEEVVRNPAVKKIAVANPDTAPYGLAAMQALEKMNVRDIAEPKLVRGENISQTAQFVETGNADAGFVALSLVLSPKLKDHGRWIVVPDDLYAPLGQAAVLTLKGAANPAAQDYLDFLSGPVAGKILEQFGYRLPR
jgi:molybdate transport system substrate-binding protein